MSQLNAPAIRRLLILALLALPACASSGAMVEDDAAPAAEPSERIGPLDGTNYVMAYADASGLRWRNTARALDTLLAPGVELRRAEPAWDGSAVALEYSVGSVVRVGVIRAGAPGVVTAMEGSPAGSFTMAWSRDGRLGVGYQPGPGEQGGVVGVGADNQVWNFGCSASNRFYAWGSGNTAVVGDATNVYGVNTRGCGTVSTLPRRGKSDFSFSADGRRVSFMMTGQRGGLYISQITGAGATQVADAAFNPRNAHWAPDGSRVAFEIRARNYANVTHVAVHDVASGQIRFFDQETELGTPIDANACWSPDARWLIHERAYYRAGATANYVTRQLVQKTVASNADRIVSEELISTGRGPDSWECWWVGSSHIVVRTADSWDLIDLATSEAFEVPAERRLLLIQPVP